MSAYHSHQEIISRLKALSDQLSKGDLSKEELKEFETLSRRIYERAIVLNYKAKEAHVYSKSVSEQVLENEESTKQEVEKEESSPGQKENPKEASDSFEGSGEIAFDFSSSDSDEEKSDEISKNDAQTEQEVNIEKEEPKKAQNPIQHEQTAEPIEESESAKEAHVSEEGISSFFERFTKVHDDSLMSKLGASKLDTLKGAIGLNDKMQFISELFDGSSDEFNAAIEKLDSLENNEKARFYLSEIAVKQSWDADSPIVEEFVRILDRRYAD